MQEERWRSAALTKVHTTYPYQTSNGFFFEKSKLFLQKSSITDICQGPEYFSMSKLDNKTLD